MNPYYELAIYDTLREETVAAHVFSAIEAGCRGVSVRPAYLPMVNFLVPEGYVLSAPIDYPYGLEDVTVRNHSIISAVNRGANAIDLVANMGLVINNKIGAFENDIGAAARICKDKGVSLRLMLEYRQWDLDMLCLVCDMAQYHKIDFVFPSTGHRVDDPIDNIICGMRLKKVTQMNVITNGNLNTEKHHKFFMASGLYGCRFSNINIMNHVLGV